MLAITNTETINALQAYGVQKILESDNTQLLFSWNATNGNYDIILTNDYKQLPPNSFNMWGFIVRDLTVGIKSELKKYI